MALTAVAAPALRPIKPGRCLPARASAHSPSFEQARRARRRVTERPSGWVAPEAQNASVESVGLWRGNSPLVQSRRAHRQLTHGRSRARPPKSRNSARSDFADEGDTYGVMELGRIRASAIAKTPNNVSAPSPKFQRVRRIDLIEVVRRFIERDSWMSPAPNGQVFHDSSGFKAHASLRIRSCAARE